MKNNKFACLSALFRMPTQILSRLTYAALSALMLLASGSLSAASFDKSINGGEVRIHYNAGGAASCDAIVLGVGTAMRSASYNKLSAKLIGYGYVVAIVDHNPGNLQKTDATKFANVANGIKQNLATWLVGKNNCRTVNHWVMGGHSAGGQAAHAAVVNDGHLADAMFNIDPYDISGQGLVSVPTLNWGFTTTTCFVDVDKAAKAAYYKSTGLRALVKVSKQYSTGPCGYSPKYMHCSFCDGHCPACTNCMTTPDHFYVDVAVSVNKFIKAAFYTGWTKSALSFTSTTPKTLFVDGEQP